MRICDNGIMRDATAEELAFFAKLKEQAEKEHSERVPTMEERIEKLEELGETIKGFLETIGLRIGG